MLKRSIPKYFLKMFPKKSKKDLEKLFSGLLGEEVLLIVDDTFKYMDFVIEIETDVSFGSKLQPTIYKNISVSRSSDLEKGIKLTYVAR